MIEESITNYVSNAYHYVTGENTIVVKTQKHDGRVRVSVFNTGNQIPEDAIEKVWIKFFKVDKARTREYGGSGIGLSIVKAVMDLHNQKCGVLNHEDGVEFWLELDNSPVEVENLEETLIDSDN
jgi:signal transduction histidine kinase